MSDPIQYEPKISFGNWLQIVVMVVACSASFYAINILAEKNATNIKTNTSAIEQNRSEISAIRKEITPIAQELKEIKAQYQYSHQSISRIEDDIRWLVRERKGGEL
jgi:septal ring factor EnvC (AmiA/AmiB activator)